jgi:hypothetical protein
MVAHQTVGIGGGIEPGERLFQEGQPGHAIVIILVNRLAAVAARSDMIESTRKLQAQRSSHELNLALSEGNSQDLTPFLHFLTQGLTGGSAGPISVSHLG